MREEVDRTMGKRKILKGQAQPRERVSEADNGKKQTPGPGVTVHDFDLSFTEDRQISVSLNVDGST